MSPLNGIKVLEFEGLGPGPLSAWMLHRMGARVTTIQRPGGGALAKLFDDRGGSLTAGKDLVALDLKTPQGVEAALDLVTGADVVIEGNRPGVMERLGLGPKECAARNPKLVYARMTGWGQDGPLAHVAGHDLNYVALSGLLSLSARPNSAPVVPPTVVGDASGALGLAFATVSALLHARATGVGQVVDAAIVDVLAMLSPLVQKVRARGQIDAGGPGLFYESPFYDAFECADGRYVSVCPIEPQFYRILLEKLGCDDLDASEQFDTAAWAAIRERFAAIFKTRTMKEWESVFGDCDACFAPVLTLAEAAQHPHNVHRGLYRTNGRGEIESVRGIRIMPL